MDPKYRADQIEPKWQKYWADKGVFNIDTADSSKKKSVLTMFPYPSGSLLHVGHARAYILPDAYARFQRKRGWRVLAPMGFDAFGLPAENYAIKNKVHPRPFTLENMSRMRSQFLRWGTLFDWNREV